MAVSLVAVGGKITAQLINQLITAVNGTALAGVIPSSTAGTGTIGSKGQVTFTNQNVVALDGVFSTSYDNYRITWNSLTRSAIQQVQFHLRGAGSDLSTSSYDYSKLVVNTSGTSASNSSSASSVPLDQGVAVNQNSNGVIDLFGPALVQATTGIAQASVYASSAVTGSQTWFVNENGNAYDGFSLFLNASATWSGTVRVYGYNTLA